MPPDAPAEQQPGLGEYLRILRRRMLAVVIVLFVVVAAVLAASLLQTPVYAATAEVLLQRRNTETPFDPNTGQPSDPQRAVQTEMRIMTSQPVKDAARRQLGYTSAVTPSPAGQTDVVNIRAEDTDPKRAAATANAYASAYITFRRSQAVDSVLAAAGQIQGKIAELQKQIEASPEAIRDSLVQQQALFKSKLDELQVTAALQSGGAQLVTGAEIPSAPVRPKPVRNVVIALVLGSFLGIGIAFVLEHLDDSIKTKDDLEGAAPHVPVLSIVPVVAGWKSKGESRVVSLTDPTSPPAEAYRTLRTAIQFMGLDEPVRALQITSPNAQEGKTTTLANLGVALARAGQRVVLVCSDLRRPRIHEFFGLSNSVGLTSVLLGDTSLAEALQNVPGVDRLSVLASGPIPPNPSELLQSRRTADILQKLYAEGTFVLIDSPPILPVSDALVISKRVDGTLLVCSSGVTGRKEFGRAVDLLHQVDAPIVGTVLNGVTAHTSYGYSYGYYGGAYQYAQNGNSGAGKARGRLLGRRHLDAGSGTDNE